ncbi:MAG: hypothetical protein FWC89_02600 [Defluviitaleaceae bacterium]|nr:hypothetical protein [Defluviitaleaceae bacterium]
MNTNSDSSFLNLGWNVETEKIFEQVTGKCDNARFFMHMRILFMVVFLLIGVISCTTLLSDGDSSGLSMGGVFIADGLFIFTIAFLKSRSQMPIRVYDEGFVFRTALKWESGWGYQGSTRGISNKKVRWGASYGAYKETYAATVAVLWENIVGITHDPNGGLMLHCKKVIELTSSTTPSRAESQPQKLRIFPKNLHDFEAYITSKLEEYKTQGKD